MKFKLSSILKQPDATAVKEYAYAIFYRDGVVLTDGQYLIRLGHSLLDRNLSGFVKKQKEMFAVPNALSFFRLIQYIDGDVSYLFDDRRSALHISYGVKGRSWCCIPIVRGEANIKGIPQVKLLKKNPFFIESGKGRADFVKEFYPAFAFADVYKESLEALAQGSELNFWGGDVVGLYFDKEGIKGAGNYSYFELPNNKVEWKKPFYLPASLARIGLGSLDVLFLNRKDDIALAYSEGEELECLFSCAGNTDIIKNQERVKIEANKYRGYSVRLIKTDRFWSRLKMLADGNVKIKTKARAMQIIGDTFEELVGEVSSSLEIEFDISFEVFKQWAEFCSGGFMMGVSKDGEKLYLYAETMSGAQMWIGVRHDYTKVS